MGKRKREEDGETEEVDEKEEVKKPKSHKKRKHGDVPVEEEKEKNQKKEENNQLLKVEEEVEQKDEDVTEEKGEEEVVAVVKKEKRMETLAPNEVLSKTYEELVELVSVIAKPMASKKLTKKLYKIVKKSQEAKQLKRGVREVVKGLRKNVKGVVVIAGDISPIDVISHIPVYCEDKGVPYCYVPSRKQLGAASLTKRPTSVVLVQSATDYSSLYQDCYNIVDSLPLPI